jgi:hypothetical protein
VPTTAVMVRIRRMPPPLVAGADGVTTRPGKSLAPAQQWHKIGRTT